MNLSVGRNDENTSEKGREKCLVVIVRRLGTEEKPQNSPPYFS